MAFDGCFVTGTDTGIGKTLISGALLHALATRGVRCVGMKPISAGFVEVDGRWRNCCACMAVVDVPAVIIAIMG